MLLHCASHVPTCDGFQMGHAKARDSQVVCTCASILPAHAMGYNSRMFSMKVKRLVSDAMLPCSAHPGDLGYDLFSAEDVVIAPGSQHKVKTGIAIQFPDGWGSVIKDRSSMASARVYSSAGVIDSGYRGEVMVLLRNDSDADYAIKKGDKVAQMIPLQAADMEVVELDELAETSRNEKGFGSSGR